MIKIVRHTMLSLPVQVGDLAEESVVSHVGGRWLLVPYPELSLPFLLFLSSDDGSTPATLNL